MRRLTTALVGVLILSTIVGAVTFAASHFTPWGTSSWYGFKAQSRVYYNNNVSSSVYITDVYTHYDNTSGTEYINCSMAQVYDGNGYRHFDVRHSTFQVAPGDYDVDYFYTGSTYYKYGNSVYILNGGSNSGNCALLFGGWDIYFLTNGAITDNWTE